MTKDEELKNAREWWIKKQNLNHDLNKDEVEAISKEAAEMLVTYYHHRLDTAWVRCADKPPEKSGTYNVNISGFGLCDGVHTLYFNEPNKLWVNPNFNDKRVKSILHDYVVDWQPLPEPPKEK